MHFVCTLGHTQEYCCLCTEEPLAGERGIQCGKQSRFRSVWSDASTEVVVLGVSEGFSRWL